MNTAQSFTVHPSTDHDRERVVHDLAAIGSADRDRPQSFPAFVADRIRTVWREHREAQERLAILRAPWTHQQAHWVPGPHGPVLHGSCPPPAGQTGPVTPGGWCPCHLYAPQEQVDDGRTA